MRYDIDGMSPQLIINWYGFVDGSSLAIVRRLSGGNALSSRPQLLHPEVEGDEFYTVWTKPDIIF